MVLRRIMAWSWFGREPGNTRGVKTVGQAVQVRLTNRKKRRRKRGQDTDEIAASEAAAAAQAGQKAAGKNGGDVKDDIPVLRYSLTAREPRADILSEEQTILIQRTIRSGQRVFHPGNVVVLGDVNPGGEIVAGGNIIVMGTFRGVAHAGATGDKRSVVAALRLEPSQLRIAGYITRAPEGDFSALKQPEIARVQDGVVVIEHYQPGVDRS
jgi:septum site-determining protein MinC